jgi:hypothetical protein
VTVQLPEAPWITLQPAAGVMNETVLEALDHLMVLAADNGIKLVLTLAGLRCHAAVCCML